MENQSEQKGFIGFDVAELQVINLGPNDVLSVKLVGDDFDQDTMESLKAHLKQVFPNNKIMVFTMPNGSDIVFEAIKPSVEAKNCSEPTSYCSDCSCGKKEMALGQDGPEEEDGPWAPGWEQRSGQKKGDENG